MQSVLGPLRPLVERENQVVKEHPRQRRHVLLPPGNRVFHIIATSSSRMAFAEKDGKECKYPHLTQAEYGAELARMKASAPAGAGG